jgi:hypothetical protein
MFIVELHLLRATSKDDPGDCHRGLSVLAYLRKLVTLIRLNLIAAGRLALQMERHLTAHTATAAVLIDEHNTGGFQRAPARPSHLPGVIDLCAAWRAAALRTPTQLAGVSTSSPDIHPVEGAQALPNQWRFACKPSIRASILRPQ